MLEWKESFTQASSNLIVFFSLLIHGRTCHSSQCFASCTVQAGFGNSIFLVKSHTIFNRSISQKPGNSNAAEYQSAALWLHFIYSLLLYPSRPFSLKKMKKSCGTITLALLSPEDVSCESKMPDSWSDRMQESTSSKPVVSSSSMSFCPSAQRQWDKRHALKQRRSFFCHRPTTPPSFCTSSWDVSNTHVVHALWGLFWLK